ncbi:hypothetical protein J8J40_31665, partial [Mycobacterium tuberculosis]|nr:hypothetical protein [Mycobacterium tuberculosis]
WRLHEGFATELLAFAAVPFVVLQVMRIAERGRALDFAGLGLAAALAVESTGPARAYLVILIAAALAQPALRRALARPALAVAV